MNWETLFYLLPYLISLGISAGVSYYAWQRRKMVGAAPFAVVSLAMALWTLGYIFELTSPTLAAKIFWDNAQWIATFAIPLAMLAFALQYTGRKLSHPRQVWGIFALISVIFLLLIFTDEFHGLIRPTARLVPNEPFTVLVYDFPLTIWIMTIYIYGLTLAALYLLLVHFRCSNLYRAQVGMVLIGFLVPLIGQLLTMVEIIPTIQRDTTPFTFAICNLLIMWGLFRYRLFDVVPQARSTVIENLPDAVIVLDAQDRVVDLNPAAQQFVGLAYSRIIGLPAQQVFAHQPDQVEQFSGVKETHTEIAVGDHGAQRYYDLTISSIYDRRGRFTGRAVVVRNITAQKQAEIKLKQHHDQLEDLVKARTAELETANEKLLQEMAEREHLEEQFRQSQKMEAIGRLSGGIAHDFNNLLIPIIGYVELGMMNLPPDSKLYVNLLQIKEAADRAAHLTRQILAFSRQQVLEIEVLDLNEVIVEFKQMIQRLIREDIELKTVLAPSLHRIRADKAQIEQVLVNLVVNARDAMPKGGKLAIETENVFLDEVDTEHYAGAQTPGHYVMMAVSDTGHGMDAETKKRIFEPFFTTKERDQGTGLGLATVFGIVKQHQGNIWVYSEPGQGTTFKIYLPKTEDVPVTDKITAPEPTSTYGTETVLVVEDEQAVRKLVCETLQAHGYNVIEAKSPSDGLQLATGCEDTIHLLLTDVVMPGMNGQELYQKVAVIRPEIKVLYMSGYTDNMIVHHGILDEGVNLLQKPFMVNTLTQKVRQVLG